MPKRVGLGAAALLCGLSGPALADPMTAPEIRATLVGHELCTSKSGGLFADLEFCFTYGQDGSFKLRKADPGEVVNWVFDQDQICLFKVSSPKDRSCASFEKVGDRRFKVNGKDTVCLGACED